MRSKQKLLVTTLLVLAMVQLSCIVANNPDDFFEKITCQWSGGNWHATPDQKDEGYCEEQQTPKDGSDEVDSQPDQAQEPAGDATNPLECDATGLLHVESQILRQETNEFGTEICEYKLTFTSDHEQGVIWLVGYRHEADIWQKTDAYEWTLLNTLDPGEGSEWFGYYSYSHDPDATGPTLLTLEKYAALFKDPACEALRTDEEFLNWIAVEVPVECIE